METETRAVDRAVAAVSEVPYRGENGRAVRQTTPAEVIARHLRLFDVRPGMRVLEVGTGSGYSAALLSELVGPSGEVVSVDVEASLVERARDVHRRTGRHNITSVTGDGFAGHTPAAPFDRVVGWTTPPLLPRAWLEQTRPGGVVLAPVPCAPMLYSTVMLRTLVADDHTPVDASAHRGQYVPMRTAAVPSAGLIEASRPREGGGEFYLSAPWLRGRGGELAEEVFSRLLAAPHSEPFDEKWPEVEHLKTWLMAGGVEHLSVAGIGRETAIGITTPDSVGLAVLFPETRFLADSGRSPALAQLHALIRRWREAARPRVEDLVPRFEEAAEGWRLRLAPPA
ncbi:protein-L-isoaspartate O-methyltransferase family protein [Streptomyces specialis]|uniref:protein-L-isoaspartate O-methyltransferase family protein n=1 Tax=Streptomyces specialis TaxID=498367 RepID=UPI00073F94ED|nr:methyltransferase domain-containing protein [Streptomyces specialis]